MRNIAFSSEINIHKPALQNFAFSFTKDNDDADDLIQETFLRAMRYANLYKDGTNLRGWLYTIMRNTFINNYRADTRRKKIIESTEELMSYQLVKSSTRNKAEGQFIGDDINKALDQLPPAYLVPFIKYFEGFKYHEIADELNIPIGTVKTRIFEARRLLKAKLKMYN
ncbi:RNA polymerase sigma factor [Pedobacter hartonius]|uniref:RNA polymerase sigma-70 factor, ECF subfamily n=1 Tax=Pedobacter hartonius TaxID=425514 RepID=A0A1H4CML5_9SPHI|nr:RNA polymerase sigma factor [Pedobacter hartonius]SEA61560.1 RNA polymerase sigma-70 factor, ECF subfamily [Pedobacter hartonius]